MNVSRSHAPNADTCLHLDWCSCKAARYACKHWHYSKTLPVGKPVYVGVWEYASFVGAIIFSAGSGAATDGRRYGLNRCFVLAELQRIALRKHESPVTRMVAIALRLLKQQCPGLRGVVSFADPTEGHHGGIYQGGNWIYTGQTAPTVYLGLLNRQWVHPRSLNKHWGKASAPKCLSGRKRITQGKHRYLYPFDAEFRDILQPLRQPYPKRAGSVDGDTPGDQPGEGGSIPTPAL